MSSLTGAPALTVLILNERDTDCERSGKALSLLGVRRADKDGAIRRASEAADPPDG